MRYNFYYNVRVTTYVRVWMMVYNHMLVPNVGQINSNHHQPS